MKWLKTRQIADRIKWDKNSYLLRRKISEWKKLQSTYIYVALFQYVQKGIQTYIIKATNLFLSIELVILDWGTRWEQFI